MPAEPRSDQHVPLLQVGPRQCRFIVSEGTENAVCCGAPTSDTSSWCPWHRQLVFEDRRERERRRAA